MPPPLPREKKGHRPGPKACFQAHRAKRATRGRSSPLSERERGRTRGSEEWLGGNGAAGLVFTRPYLGRSVGIIAPTDSTVESSVLTALRMIAQHQFRMWWCPGRICGWKFSVGGRVFMQLTKPSAASLSSAHLHQGSGTDICTKQSLSQSMSLRIYHKPTQSSI